MPEVGRGWVDLEQGLYHRAAKGEEVTNKRKPPIRLPKPLLGHLRRWHKKRPGPRYVVEWNGKPVGSINRSWASARKDAKVSEDATPHALRHSAITWAMQAGADKWEVAGYFGVSLAVIEAVYAHHHPDHQETVHRALSAGKRSAKPVLKVIEGG
ncbi:MAG: tyrosine-type recombinase/integrase [Devosia sp.]